MKRLLLLALLFTTFFIPAFQGQEEIETQILRDGDLAVYLISFPFSYEQYEFVNYTLVVNEIPMDVYNPLIVTFAVWNATKQHKLYFYIDDRKIEITREGVMNFYLNLTLGVHNLVLMTDNVILTHALVNVKAFKSQEFITISIASYRLKINQATLQGFYYALIGAIIGIALGIFIRKRTYILNYYALIIPGSILTFAILIFSLNMHLGILLTALGLAAIVSYVLAQDYCNWLFVTLLHRTNTGELSNAELIQLPIISRDKYLVVQSGLKGILGKHKVLEEQDVYPLQLNAYKWDIARDIEEKDDRVIIYGDYYLAKALVEAGIVEKLSSENYLLQEENIALKRTSEVNTLRKAREILDQFLEDLKQYLLKEKKEDVRKE